MQLYRKLATLVQAIDNCRNKLPPNKEWAARHGDAIDELVRKHLPSGSGFDAGTVLIMERSTPERLVFEADYHHMNEGGYYDGWSEHEVIVTPSLASGFDLRVTGRNRDDIKAYIGEVFGDALTIEIG